MHFQWWSRISLFFIYNSMYLSVGFLEIWHRLLYLYCKKNKKSGWNGYFCQCIHFHLNFVEVFSRLTRGCALIALWDIIWARSTNKYKETHKLKIIIYLSTEIKLHNNYSTYILCAAENETPQLHYSQSKVA